MGAFCSSPGLRLWGLPNSLPVSAPLQRADDPLAEIDWLETLDKSSGVAARYIGFADLTASDSGDALDRLSAVERCVGVRQILSWHPSERESLPC